MGAQHPIPKSPSQRRNKNLWRVTANPPCKPVQRPTGARHTTYEKPGSVSWGATATPATGASLSYLLQRHCIASLSSVLLSSEIEFEGLRPLGCWVHGLQLLVPGFLVSVTDLLRFPLLRRPLATLTP